MCKLAVEDVYNDGRFWDSRVPKLARKRNCNVNERLWAPLGVLHGSRASRQQHGKKALGTGAYQYSSYFGNGSDPKTGMPAVYTGLASAQAVFAANEGSLEDRPLTCLGSAGPYV